MVVAGTEMRVGPDGAGFAAHHQRQFRVGFEFGEAEHHLDPGRLHRTGEADVGFLVEAGAQFHHGGDGFAGFRGLDQRLDDRAVAAGTVQRLLDGDHAGILRGLAQELHHDVETLVGVVDDDVLGANGGETIAAEVADAFGEAGGVGLEQEVRPVLDDELFQVGRRQETVFRVGFVVRRAERIADKRPQIVGHVLVELEMDHHAPAAPFQRGFVGTDEVFRFFLEFHIGIANDPEQALAGHAESRKHAIEEQEDQVLQQHEPDRFVRSAGGQANEALDLRRQRQQAAHRQPVFLPQQQQGHDEAHVGNEGERVCGIDGQWGQNGKHPLHEPRIQPVPVAFGQGGGLADLDPFFSQQSGQIPPHALLIGQQGFGARFDLRQLLCGGAPVGGHMGYAGLGLALQPGDADGIELIEVGRADRQEAQPLQERMAGVLGLLDHAVVEVEPGEFPVDEAFRACQGDWMRFRRTVERDRLVAMGEFMGDGVSFHAATIQDGRLCRRGGTRRR